MLHGMGAQQIALSSVLLAFIAGCSGTSGGGYACPALALVGPRLLYPIPGATGIPDGAGIFVFDGSTLSSAAVVLTASGLPTQALGNLKAPVPTPIPSPIATPFSGADKLTYVSHGSLTANTTFQISFVNQANGSCIVPIGGSYNFTTQ